MKKDEAIRIINKHFPSSSCGEYEELREALNMAIEELRTNCWIPCSERLPRYGEYVLTFRPTMAMEMVVDSYVGFYGEDDDEWYEGWSIASFGSNDDIVTAWMPLPEAWKGESNDN